MKEDPSLYLVCLATSTTFNVSLLLPSVTMNTCGPNMEAGI